MPERAPMVVLDGRGVWIVPTIRVRLTISAVSGFVRTSRFSPLDECCESGS